MVLDGKSSQEYLNAGVPQGCILVPALLLYTNNLPVDVICNIAIYADNTRVLTRPYLITLYIIFFFFFKKTLFMILYMHMVID